MRPVNLSYHRDAQGDFPLFHLLFDLFLFRAGAGGRFGFVDYFCAGAADEGDGTGDGDFGGGVGVGGRAWVYCFGGGGGTGGQG